MDRAIQKADARIASVLKDREALRAYQMRAMAMSDWTSAINQAKRENSVEIARKMKALGLASVQITAATGLTTEEIGEI
jgi:predicted transposase/invertase (TIGR01784 family)